MVPKVVKNIERGWLTKEWNNRWNKETSCRQTKRCWPTINWGTSREVRTLGRDDLAKMIQIVTGHGFNKYHLGKEAGVEILGCRFCEDNVREDTWHIANECKSLDSFRRGKEGTGIKLNYPRDVMRLTRLFGDIDSLFHPLGSDQKSGETLPTPTG